MEQSRPRNIQRTILIVVFAIGIIWGVSVLTKGGPPAGGQIGAALAGGSVALTAQVDNSGVAVKGTVQDKNIGAVYVYALRRITIAGTEVRSVVAATKKVNAVNGSFQTTFSPDDLKGWQAAADKALKGRPFAADGVLELAVSGYTMENFVNRDLIAASTFVGYQK